MADDNANGGIDLSAMAYEIARRRQAAAIQVVEMLEAELGTWFDSSAATLLHAGAWLSGGSLRHSLQENGEGGIEGAPSTRANEEQLKLMKVFMFLVDKDGVKLKPEDFAADIPEADQPRRRLADVQRQFQAHYDEIMQQHGFDYLEGARTGAVACARLLRMHCLNRADIEPRIAASIVSKGFVEGATINPAKPGS